MSFVLYIVECDHLCLVTPSPMQRGAIGNVLTIAPLQPYPWREGNMECIALLHPYPWRECIMECIDHCPVTPPPLERGAMGNVLTFALLNPCQ